MKNLAPRRRLALRLALFAVLACLPLSVSAQNAAQPWSTIASAGEADDLSQPLVDYNGSFASIKTSAPSSSTVILRYSVAPVDGLFFNGCKALRVRFRDDGGGASVTVYLKRVDIGTGTVTNVLNFLSSSFASAATYQTQVGTCLSHNFDFNRYSYWIEATMGRTLFQEVVGKPGLQAIQITTVIG